MHVQKMHEAGKQVTNLYESCEHRNHACLYRDGTIKLKEGQMCGYDRDYSYGEEPTEKPKPIIGTQERMDV